MDVRSALINELKFEASNTRKMLSRVPFDKQEWRPHEKSTQLLNLAKHVARTTSWIPYILEHEEVNFATSPFPPYPELKSSEELVAYYDQIVSDAAKAIESAPGEEFMKPFSMKMGDHVISTMPKAAVLRNMGFNHSTHHRGQLSV